ncbi:TspO/MBR family protein [Hydrotalea sp.]|uniref:TspO/MBR family protein n=1 Tax=Hydrotalea sp. TaxID=2881279 RepID=UPI0026039516|nr:TspO/MBR family protein [Hydrotalea sp.]
MGKFSVLKLVVSVVVIMALGAAGGIVTITQITTWYAQLNKPFFNPPNSIFVPVWTFLYASMGVSFYLLWNSPVSYKKNRAMLFFVIQFLLNMAWSLIFFYFHETGWALAEILVMWLFILLTIVYSASVQKWAAWLLIPYLSWVCFAAILNFAIYVLN